MAGVRASQKFSDGAWIQQGQNLTKADMFNIVNQKDKIEKLVLNYLKIEADANELLKEFLFENLTLKTLKISWVSLSEEQRDIIQNSVKDALNLITIKLAATDTLEEILKANNSTIEVVELSGQNVGFDFLDALGGNLHVRRLDLSDVDNGGLPSVIDDLLDTNFALVQVKFPTKTYWEGHEESIKEKLARNQKLMDVLNARLEQHYHKQDLMHLFASA